MNCFGFLIFMHCAVAQPVVVSDFCQVAGPDIQRLGTFTDAEIVPLNRQHKEAIVSLKRKRTKLCP